MGLMDAFNPEATTELKAGELYKMLQQAAENENTAKFLLNGVKKRSSLPPKRHKSRQWRVKGFCQI